MSEAQWYAVHTKPRREQETCVYLNRAGYQTFYPFTRTLRHYNYRTGRVAREVDLPFFSRYIFVCLTKPTQSLYDVNETYGVSTVVYIGGEALEIPHPVMDELMRRTDEDGLVRVEKPPHWFTGKVGDKVQLADEAPYFGMLGELSSLAGLDGRDEISIWLKMLGGTREVVVPAQAVARFVA